MHHYQECGLPNIWLVNGYQKIGTPYGEAVSICDVDGLDKAIAHALIAYKPKFTGREFRFLRKHLRLSQAGLANMLGNNEQSVALWEKKGNSPKWANNLLRLLVAESHGENSKVRETIERFNDVDRDAYEKSLHFEEREHSWNIAA